MPAPSQADLIDRIALDAAQAEPQIPPIEVPLVNCNIQVGQTMIDGQKHKAIIVTHASGGVRFFIPLPAAAARDIGNALCDRPTVHVPGPGGI